MFLILKNSLDMLKPNIGFLGIRQISLESFWSKVSFENIKNANVE